MAGPAGTERDGERKWEQSGRGETVENRRCGGSGWMQEDCARRVRKREGGYRRRWRRLRSNGDVSVHADVESVSALA